MLPAGLRPAPIHPAADRHLLRVVLVDEVGFHVPACERVVALAVEERDSVEHAQVEPCFFEHLPAVAQRVALRVGGEHVESHLRLGLPRGERERDFLVGLPALGAGDGRKRRAACAHHVGVYQVVGLAEARNAERHAVQVLLCLLIPRLRVVRVEDDPRMLGHHQVVVRVRLVDEHARFALGCEAVLAVRVLGVLVSELHAARQVDERQRQRAEHHGAHGAPDERLAHGHVERVERDVGHERGRGRRQARHRVDRVRAEHQRGHAPGQKAQNGLAACEHRDALPCLLGRVGQPVGHPLPHRYLALVSLRSGRAARSRDSRASCCARAWSCRACSRPRSSATCSLNWRSFIGFEAERDAAAF